MESLKDKIAIVTGGTRGIGRAIVENLLREGVAVAFCGRSSESVSRAVAELSPIGRVFGAPADISRADSVHAFFQAFDREFSVLDILVNNAGLGVFKKVADLTPEDWHRNIDLNLNGAFYCTREALTRFRRERGGFVVNISSLAGKNPFSGGAAYNASKFGLNGFTEALMLDHRHDNVRVCSIMPGSVATDFSGDASRPRSDDTSWMIAPEDVAETVTHVLRLSPRTMISRVEMRPSKPHK